MLKSPVRSPVLHTRNYELVKLGLGFPEGKESKCTSSGMRVLIKNTFPQLGRLVHRTFNETQKYPVLPKHFCNVSKLSLYCSLGPSLGTSKSPLSSTVASTSGEQAEPHGRLNGKFSSTPLSSSSLSLNDNGLSRPSRAHTLTGCS
jgi:hypothetical protein